jgi:hypothetical protein
MSSRLGVNFYSPTYVSIGRKLAEKSYTSFSVNTRMHDLGNIEGYEGDKRLRGGGYWGVVIKLKTLQPGLIFPNLMALKKWY